MVLASVAISEDCDVTASHKLVQSHPSVADLQEDLNIVPAPKRKPSNSGALPSGHFTFRVSNRFGL